MPSRPLNLAITEWTSRFWHPYIGIFIAALALRLYGLGSQNLWWDEFCTLTVTRIPLAELPDRLPEAESKPPLYFALMHFWAKLGTGEFWLRLPSAIFGATECVVVAALGKQIFGSRLGVWLGWLAVFAPLHIYYSQEARPYALWSLLVTVTLLFLLRYCASPDTGKLVGYVSFAVLALYTFPYAFVVVGFSAVLAALYRPPLSMNHRRRLMLANGLILLLYMPWMWEIISASIANVGFQPVHRGPTYAAAAYALSSLGFGMSAGPSLEKLRLFGLDVFREAPVSSGVLVFSFLLLIVLLGYGLLLLWKTRRNGFYFSLLGLLTFWGSAVVLNVVDPDIPLNPRYAFPAVIPILVEVMAVWIHGSKKRLWGIGLSILFVLVTTFSLVNHYFNPAYHRDDVRGAARFLDRLHPPVERVFVCAGFLAPVFDHYSESDRAADPVDIAPGASSPDALQPIVDRLAAERRFALVYVRPDYGDPEGVLPAAMQMRARLVEQHRATGVDVFVFESNLVSPR